MISDLVLQDKKNIFASFIKIISSFIGWNFLHLNEWKVVLMTPQKVCKSVISISSTSSTFQITMKMYQQVCSVKRSKLAKFRDDISIEEVMTSHIFWYDIKIWWRHISVKNFGIALKLCRLFDLVVAIICTNFCEFSQSRSWFTEIPSFTDVAYLWRHWRLPTAYYKRHGLKNSLVLNEKG